MSFQITKPGFYRQRNGGKAKVFACRNGLWYGRELDRSGFDGNCWNEHGDAYVGGGDRNIVSEYHEPPFRISDHGCGVYETRHGMRAIVSSKDDSQWPWRGRICDLNADASWKDDGVFGVLGNFALDLVRYIGPLPEPQPEWVATNRWRNRVLNRDAGGTLPDGTISCVVDGAWKFVVPEQLWTCGDREDWRTAEVQR